MCILYFKHVIILLTFLYLDPSASRRKRKMAFSENKFKSELDNLSFANNPGFGSKFLLRIVMFSQWFGFLDTYKCTIILHVGQTYTIFASLEFFFMYNIKK